MQIPLESCAELPLCRIWWYPTGPLTFIPIHAAGPGDGAIDVGRMVIFSYVTILNTLFQVRKIIPTSSGQLKLLAISQPNTPGQNPISKATQEVLKLVEAAGSAGWAQDDIVPLHGSDAIVELV